MRVERQYPIRGIREDLPPGEQVLWQGAPAVLPLARQAFHLRQVAVYFAALLALRVTLQLGDGVALSSALVSALPLTALAGLGLALLLALAWWSSRTTVYAVTTRRVVMKIGMALPIVVNLPLASIEAARLKMHGDGSGELPLKLSGDVRLAYVHLWPHVRPWHLTHPEPMLRALPQATQVADALAQALAATGGVATGVATSAPLHKPHVQPGHRSLTPITS